MADHPARTEEFLIKSYDVDLTGALKLQSLFNYLQEIAGNHATELGVGFDELNTRGLFWVLSRIKIIIDRMPSWRERVSLTTWPKGVDKLFALRDFRLIDAQRNTLLKATTAWLLLDRERNRPQRIDVLPIDIHRYHVEHAIAEPLGKLKPEIDLTLRHEKKILISDLDVNNHVNNAEYIRWIVDCFDFNRLHRGTIQSIQVNYLDEALFDDTIVLSMADENGKGESYYIEGISRTSGAKVVQASIRWR